MCGLWGVGGGGGTSVMQEDYLTLDRWTCTICWGFLVVGRFRVSEVGFDHEREYYDRRWKLADIEKLE